MIPNSFTIVAPSPELARQLRDIAIILGANIVQENVQETKINKVEPLAKKVVCDMFTIKQEDISSELRNADTYQARLLYANLLLYYGSNVRNIQRFLRKSSGTVRGYLNYHLMYYNQDERYTINFNNCLKVINYKLL